MDIHLLKAWETETSEEIDTIPAAWLAKRLVHFLRKLPCGMPERPIGWILQGIDTSTVINKNHPEQGWQAKRSPHSGENADFEPIIRRFGSESCLCARV